MNPFTSKKNLRQHLIDLTKGLIAFPSTSSEPEQIRALADFIAAYFANDPVVIKRYIQNGFPSLVIGTQETKHPDILLSGHIDVVPSSNRYTAVEEGPLLHGSGALDMKGGVAVMMALLQYFCRQKNAPALAIMLTPDEETGSKNGTKYLLGEENYRANFAIINEGRPRYDIVTREKGVLVLTFRCTGQSIHSAYPWQADNVIEDLMKFLLRIKKIFPKPADKWVTTGSITVLNAGKETNTIPAQSEAVLNIRLTGGKHWSQEEILKKINAHLPENIQIVHMAAGGIFEADTRNPLLQLLRKAASKVVGKPVQFGENHGASDAKVFQSHDIPTAVLGPVGRNHHSPQEFVEIDSLVTHFEVLRHFVELHQERSEKLKKTLLTA